MKFLYKIKGTQKKDPSGIEIGKDTVYIRNNSKKIEEDEFVGWEYDEIQYEKNEYLKIISEDNIQSKIIISDLLETMIENGVI
jgi:hypothetical protein